MRSYIKKKVSATAIAVVSLVGFAACGSSTLPPPMARLHYGTARLARNVRLVALPASCGAVEKACEPGLSLALDAVVRSELEFRGHPIVEGETLFLRARSRKETTQAYSNTSISPTGGGYGTNSQISTTELEGENFNDLPLLDRMYLIQEVGAAGVVQPRIFIGGALGPAGRQKYRVQISMVAGDREELVWTTQCEVVGGIEYTPARAIELAANCALRAVPE